jgi:hypothetical protein
MKRLVLLLPTVLLTGCLATAPVVPKWPDVPKELLVACPDLKTIDPANNKISTLIETVADNYKEYYQCKDKVDDWITWYNGQQKLWETLK